MNQAEAKASTGNQWKAEENFCKSRLVLVLLQIGWESVNSFSNQSQSIVMQNQGKEE